MTSLFTEDAQREVVLSRVVAGLDGIPDRRPVLIVGNHQLMAPDTFLLVEHLVREKGILLRGLSHPLVVNVRPRPFHP